MRRNHRRRKRFASSALRLLLSLPLFKLLPMRLPTGTASHYPWNERKPLDVWISRTNEEHLHSGIAACEIQLSIVLHPTLQSHRAEECKVTGLQCVCDVTSSAQVVSHACESHRIW